MSLASTRVSVIDEQNAFHSLTRESLRISYLHSSSATDGKDGDVTSKVVVTGWVSRDTSVIGKQVLTYTVTDSDLNVAFVVRYAAILSFTMNTYI